jgi:hypothetical protein
MPTPERLAEQFEEHRAHLRAVADMHILADPERLKRVDLSAIES